MRIATLIVAPALLSACAPAPAPLPGPGGVCSAGSLGDLVGRAASAGLVERSRRRAGAAVARVLRPGQIVTMEYRAGRLDVHVDRDGRVTSFSCG